VALIGTTTKFFRHIVVYGMGNIANKIISVILIPVATKYLTIIEVGILGLLEMLELFLTTILSQGMGAAIWRFMDSNSDDKDSTILFSAFIGRMVVNILVIFILLIFSEVITNVLNIPFDYLNIVILIILNSLMVVSSNFVLNIWRYYDRSILYSIYSTSRFVLIITLSLYFVIVLDLQLFGIVYAKIIVNAMGFIHSVIYVIRKYRSKISLSLYYKLQKYGIYFILLALVTPVLTTMNRLFINYYLTLSDVAIFSIAFKFGMLINILLVTPMQLAWLPMMYKIGYGENSKKYYRDFAYYYSIISSFVFLIITIFREEMLLVLTTSDYLSGAKYIPIIAAAYLVNGYRHFFMSGLAIKDRTSFLGYASIIAILINIILNNWFVNLYGIWGAALTTFLSYLALTSIILIFSQKIVKIEWGLLNILKIMFYMLVFTLGSEILINTTDLSSWLIRCIILISYILTLILTGLISRNEIIGINNLIKGAIKFVQSKQ
jgi:O-antigen/teichoic acid export membrane protein